MRKRLSKQNLPRGDEFPSIISEVPENSVQNQKETIVKGVRRIENMDVSQIQLIFSKMPSPQDNYNLLYNFGFSYLKGAKLYQRHLNDHGCRAADRFLQSYSPESD